jgi:hypothetical protein
MDAAAGPPQPFPPTTQPSWVRLKYRQIVQHITAAGTMQHSVLAIQRCCFSLLSLMRRCQLTCAAVPDRQADGLHGVAVDCLYAYDCVHMLVVRPLASSPGCSSGATTASSTHGAAHKVHLQTDGAPVDKNMPACSGPAKSVMIILSALRVQLNLRRVDTPMPAASQSPTRAVP